MLFSLCFGPRPLVPDFTQESFKGENLTSGTSGGCFENVK